MKTWYSSPNAIYTCKITSALIARSDYRTIISLIGTHLVGKSNRDVEAVWFSKTVVNYVPRGLHTSFPNLTGICISECGLMEITRDDFKGLENFKIIYFNNNQLKHLQSNLCVNMPKLTHISFNSNKLEFVSSKLLQPIMSNGLDLVDFRKNKNINVSRTSWKC